MKSVRIPSYSGAHFPAFGLNMETRYLLVFSPNAENADQNNAEYGHFLCSVKLHTDLKIVTAMTPEQG